ncbi:unnamed protein product [Ilex paraguariensis]|uniref:WRKY domain-containing protein n=1 Tax=Ilex paraguariensis TaxID=185542 RepID=A0ABC8U3J3_9AQUA
MGTPLPEKFSSTKRKRAIKELVNGRKFATQLQVLLEKPHGDHGYVSSAEELAEKILTSFTETLSVLNSCDGDLVQIHPTAHVGSTCYSDGASQDCGDSRTNPAAKDRRGSYKRRKTSDSWIIVSHTMEDSNAWRKYGQKEILNAKYPRCYFRCTHKHDQGCRATKQVQRTEEDPMKYQTTYFGHHTCKARLKGPQLIFSDPDPPAESYLLNFESNNIPSNKQNHPSLKEESKEDTHSELSDNVSSMDSIWWPDLMALESSRLGMMLGPKMGSDYEDMGSSVYSNAVSASSHGLEIDTLINTVDFDNEFQLDEIEFL